MLSPTCLGWVESGASAGDQCGEVHSVNTGFVPQHCLSKRKVLISTEVRKECCWPGSCRYLDFCMGIDGEKKMFLQTQPYPLAHFIISFTQSICILYKWCLTSVFSLPRGNGSKWLLFSYGFGIFHTS